MPAGFQALCGDKYSGKLRDKASAALHAENLLLGIQLHNNVQKYRNTVQKYSREIQWGNMVKKYSGEIQWRNTVEKYSLEVWLRNTVEFCSSKNLSTSKMGQIQRFLIWEFGCL